MYGYLKEFRIAKEEVANTPTNENIFLPVTEEEILAAEAALGISFPAELRAFYSEIGYGFLLQGVNGEVAHELNRILHPDQVFECLLQADGEWPEGDLPVFEANYDYFLVTRPRSNNPDALFISGFDTPLATSFADFVRRLYFQSSNFYWDRIR